MIKLGGQLFVLFSFSLPVSPMESSSSALRCVLQPGLEWPLVSLRIADWHWFLPVPSAVALHQSNLRTAFPHRP